MSQRIELLPHASVQLNPKTGNINQINFFGSSIGVYDPTEPQYYVPSEENVDKVVVGMVALTAIGLSKEAVYDLYGATPNTPVERTVTQAAAGLGLANNRRAAGRVGHAFRAGYLTVYESLKLPHESNMSYTVLDSLTDRILRRLSRGMNNQEMSEALNIPAARLGRTLAQFKETFGLQSDAAAVTFGHAHALNARPLSQMPLRSSQSTASEALVEDSGALITELNGNSYRVDWQGGQFIVDFPGGLNHNEQTGAIYLMLGLSQSQARALANLSGSQIKSIRAKLSASFTSEASLPHAFINNNALRIQKRIPLSNNNFEELDIRLLELAAEGLSQEKAAERCGLKSNEAVNRYTRIKTIFGVQRKSELVMFAYASGVI